MARGSNSATRPVALPELYVRAIDHSIPCMHPSIYLSLIVALACTGCSVFQKSQTWQKVIDTRTERTAGGGEAYNDQLHQTLASENVEHKVITYQYRYKTRLREDAVGTGTAVIYRDSTNPSNPWWIMDEHLAAPVWLPNEDVDRQVKFYLRRDAQVLAQQDYPAGDRSKEATEQPAMAAPSAMQSSTLMARSKAPKAENRARSEQMIAKRAPARDAAPRLIARAPAMVAPPPLELEAINRTESAESRPLLSRVSPAVRPARFPSDVTNADKPRVAPSELERRADAAFRTRHGTGFDPASSVDREKMDSLRQALLSRVQSLEAREL
ncbi:MAG: hypothetical protein JWQ44_1962 [Chthoniobacter sp.]|nr:hypothetical protein [Chthoniobacter sp.]